jgi:DNA-binding transcriptional regulator YdaS (Cro superfamily)
MPRHHRCDPAAIKRAIDIFGTQDKLAQVLDVRQHSVSRWVIGLRSPEPDTCRLIEKVTEGKVTRQELLPTYDWDKYK